MSTLCTALVAGLLAALVGGDEPDVAPADAWPMARGCSGGTGRSATALGLPLGEAWHRQFPDTAFGAVPVIAFGTVFIGDLDGTFRALSLAEGADRWSFAAQDTGFPSAAAAGVAGDARLVVVGDDGGLVRAFDALTGELRWTHATEGEISGGPTILEAADGPRVLVGSQDASLACLALADGRLIWRLTVADQIRCSPTVARTAAGNRVFLAGCDGTLHVIDADSGVERAAVPIDGPTGTTPAVSGERVFFGTEGGLFFGIDVAAGREAWRTAAATAGQSYRSSAAIAEGLAIVGFRGKAVEAFITADGTRAWRRPMRGRVDASPTVLSAHGPGAAAARPVVIVADTAGGVTVLEASDGAALWEFDAGGGFDAGAAVADGRVVLASVDGTLWCFRGCD